MTVRTLASAGQLQHAFETKHIRDLIHLARPPFLSPAFEENVFAREGYEFAVRAAHALNGGRGFDIVGADNRSYYFKFNLNIDTSFVTPPQQQLLVDSLVGANGTYRGHFMLGSHPAYAARESAVSLEHSRLLLQCCVGADPFYQTAKNIFMFGVQTRDAARGFGMQVSNAMYTADFVKTAYLNYQVQDAAFAVLGAGDNFFTNTTCNAALGFIASSPNARLISDDRYVTLNSTNGITADQFAALVAKAVASEATYLIVCGFVPDADLTLQTLESLRALERFSGVFMTVGPTTDDFVVVHGHRADYVLSAGQWYHTQFIEDDGFFGNSLNYSALFARAYGANPHYTAAGATAAVHVIMHSIQQAFEGCDLSGIGSTDELLFQAQLNCSQATGALLGTSGYARLHQQLRQTNGINEVLTVFGAIAFNANRRNVGMTPVTTQVLPVNETAWEVTAVSPLATATQEMQVPVLFSGPASDRLAIILGSAGASAAALLVLVSALLCLWRRRLTNGAAPGPSGSPPPKLRMPSADGASSEHKAEHEPKGEDEATISTQAGGAEPPAQASNEPGVASAKGAARRPRGLSVVMSGHSICFSPRDPDQFFREVEVGKVIGVGAFGRVHRAKWHGMTDVAVKVVRSADIQKESHRELEISMVVRHPNVVTMFDHMDRIIDVATDGSKRDGATVQLMRETWMVLELCDGEIRLSQLQDSVPEGGSRRDGSTWRKLHALLACRDVAVGMHYLHSHDIVHGDLKASNILVVKKATDVRGYFLKVSDFGLSHILGLGETQIISSFFGTTSHAAPEYMLKGKLSKACDAFSFGIVMWEFLVGERPWKGCKRQEIMSRVLMRDERPPWPAWAPRDYVMLARQCTQLDEHNRPSFREIINDLNCMLVQLLDEMDANGEPVVTRAFLEDIGALPRHVVDIAPYRSTRSSQLTPSFVSAPDIASRLHMLQSLQSDSSPAADAGTITPQPSLANADPFSPTSIPEASQLRALHAMQTSESFLESACDHTSDRLSLVCSYPDEESAARQHLPRLVVGSARSLAQALGDDEEAEARSCGLSAPQIGSSTRLVSQFGSFLCAADTSGSQAGGPAQASRGSSGLPTIPGGEEPLAMPAPGDPETEAFARLQAEASCERSLEELFVSQSWSKDSGQTSHSHTGPNWIESGFQSTHKSGSVYDRVTGDRVTGERVTDPTLFMSQVLESSSLDQADLTE